MVDFDMRMKLLAFAPAVALLAGACATSTSAETFGLSGVTTSLTSVVDDPQSSTWAMLLVGFLGLGYAARPRRKKSRLEGLIAGPEGRRGFVRRTSAWAERRSPGLVGSLDDVDPLAEITASGRSSGRIGVAMPSPRGDHRSLSATPTSCLFLAEKPRLSYAQ